MSAARQSVWLQDWRRRAFATPLDTVLTLGVGLLLLWLLWIAVDWALLRAVFRAEDVVQCQDKAAGACWSVIDARHRLILFGLYPYDEHWRSTAAAPADSDALPSFTIGDTE